MLSNNQNFWDKVDIGPNATWCWLWRGYIARDGYGSAARGARKNVRAHRAIYEEMVGAIPKGLQLDHKCRNRSCVNPFHLEPVSCRENVLRGEGVAAINARKMHCKRGHEFVGANTYIAPNGQRVCKECKRLWNKTYVRSKHA